MKQLASTLISSIFISIKDYLMVANNRGETKNTLLIILTKNKIQYLLEN